MWRILCFYFRPRLEFYCQTNLLGFFVYPNRALWQVPFGISKAVRGAIKRAPGNHGLIAGLSNGRCLIEH